MINKLAVVDEDLHILFLGSFAECYNYMLENPTAWRDLRYACHNKKATYIFNSAPIKLAEIQLQHHLNRAARLQ